MSKKKKVSADIKLIAVKEYLAGNGSLTTIGKKYRITESSFRKWVAKYRDFGDSAFIQTTHCNHYMLEFKMKVVSEYLDRKGSLYNLAVKYKIPSHITLSRWVLKYNSHEELKFPQQYYY